ncbi:MAG: GNAT family N-acetyltransferase [Ruminiclostridium sp.]|nr:GNAT family N-acetyltransferase [Ruminiclostridium sp.]
MTEPETQRLKLRRIMADDAQSMFDTWTSDPEVPKYMTWYAHKDVSETKRLVDIWLKDYENPDCYRYVIVLKSTGEIIGMIDVVEYRDGCPVIGYCSGKRFWGNGYMTEALKAFIGELFSDGYETLLIEAVKENIGSNRVIRKCGFEFTGSEVRPHSAAKPEPVTLNFYKLTRNVS